MIKRVPAYRLLSFAIATLMFLASCGKGEREIPVEETGQPNTLPVEMVLYREARDTFLAWTRAFAPERQLSGTFALLSDRSRRVLRERGIGDAAAFARWFEERAMERATPFSYTLSRFDVLDIELQDSTRAVVTATFLVHIHQGSFESVGSFILKREKGRWVVPFAESGNFESSWWEKEKQFAQRLSEEGLSRVSSEALGLSFRYPVAWDVVSSSTASIPDQPSLLPGVELQYLDPTTLSPVAFARVAALPGPLPDSLLVRADTTAPAPLRTLSTRRISADRGRPVDGEIRTIADPARNRYLLLYTAVDAAQGTYDRFSETFNAIRTSLKPTTEVLP